MKLTAKEILAIIEASEFDVFGLRADRAGIERGEHFENSHQWWQDYIWDDEFVDDIYNDPEHPYNAEMGCWDDGELDGVCTIGIDDLTEAAIEKALEDFRPYTIGAEALYLVGGDWGNKGNDFGELIIGNSECLAALH